MTKFSGKTVLLLLFAFVLLSVAFRYPLVEHERQQTDSYFIHMLSGAIVDEGYAEWVFNPLSLFGYYPFSYPSGVPFLVAELAELTGTTVDVAILMADMMLSILFCLAVFLLARQFFMRGEFVLLVTLLAILGPRFIDTTYWDGGARGFAVVMMTLVVLVLFRAAATYQFRLYPISALFVAGCFVIHHMAVLLVLVAIGYLVASIELRYVLPRLGTHRRLWLGAVNCVLALFLFALSLYSSAFSGNQLLTDLANGSLFDIEPEVLSVMLNLASSYTSQIGFIVPIAVLGIPCLFFERRITMETLLPLTVLIAFIPLLGSSLYVSMVVAPYVAILGVFVLSRMWRTKRHRRLAVVAMSILVIGSLILPVWAVQRWNQEVHMAGDTVEVDSQLYDDSLYLRYSGFDSGAISNVNALALELAAVSGVSFLGSGLFMPLSGDVNESEVSGNIVWSSARFPLNLYKWFEYENESSVDNYVRILMINGLIPVFETGSHSLVADYFLEHPKMIVAIDNAQATNYVDSYSVRYSEFARELYSATSPTTSVDGSVSANLASYLYYQSEGVSLFLFELPY